MLGDIVGKRTRDRILQQHFVGLQALPVHLLDLPGVKVHRQNADRQQYAEDDVEERNPRGNGQFQGQKTVLSSPSSGGKLVRSLPL
jgi:hypothetical protein